MPRPSPAVPQQADRPEPSTPWWRVGMVWLVVGGPLAVVVAALVTAVIAASGADDVLPQAGGGASAPAIQARNHAASPRP
jgi:hypothetical protein